MGCRARTFVGLTVLLTALAGQVRGQQAGGDMPKAAAAPVGIPLNDITGTARDKVRTVAEQPTLITHGPAEAFACQPNVYRWLLDNPEQAARLWRILGAKCADIQKQDENKWGYQDAQGTKVTWGVVLDNGRQRVWYAEGQVKPGMLLPMVQVQAVLLLTYCEGTDNKGRSAMRHQMDLYIKTDSAAVALATRLLGSSGPRMAEQYVGQIEMFYAAMAWYLDQHPERAEAMYQELQRPEKKK
jgi:hypothetical protein